MAAQPLVGRTVMRGLLLASAVGAGVAAVNISRRYQQSDHRAIDWEQVRRISVGMVSKGVALNEVSRPALEARYRGWISEVEPKIGAYLQTALPRPLETVYVFDRVEWIDANIANFRRLFTPLEDVYNELISRGMKTAPLVGGINQLVMSSQIGLLLGYLAKRVLGQYDMSLLGREPLNSGKLYFLEQNIHATDQKLQLQADQFRLWICLHEATHAYEFEAHPWLATHMNEQIDGHMQAVTNQIRHIKLDGAMVEETIHRVIGGIVEGRHWMELFMSDEQRRIFQHLQALMSLLEGYSNHVMDHIGGELMPDYGQIKRKFEMRRQKKSRADQIFGKLTGLDLKMEQYSQGERFVNAVVAERGIGFMNRVWEGPDALPTMQEIRDHRRWIQRIDSRGRHLFALNNR